MFFQSKPKPEPQPEAGEVPPPAEVPPPPAEKQLPPPEPAPQEVPKPEASEQKNEEPEPPKRQPKEQAKAGEQGAMQVLAKSSVKKVAPAPRTEKPQQPKCTPAVYAQPAPKKTPQK